MDIMFEDDVFFPFKGPGLYFLYGCFQKIRIPPKWMVKIMENPIRNGMICGEKVPLFSVQHPYVSFNRSCISPYLERQVSYFFGQLETPKTSNYCLKNRAFLGFPGSFSMVSMAHVLAVSTDSPKGCGATSDVAPWWLTSMDTTPAAQRRSSVEETVRFDCQCWFLGGPSCPPQKK